MAIYTLGKKERLKSTKLIQYLFESGQSIKAFPFRLIYAEVPDWYITEEPLLFAVTVPKRRFKKAVSRNQIKRLIREAYRLQKLPCKQLLTDHNKKVAIMVQFIHHEHPEYELVEKKMKILLKRLHSNLGNQFTPQKDID